MRRMNVAVLLALICFANYATASIAEEPRVTLTKIVNPPGSGEIAAQPLPGLDGKYTSGTFVTLTAHAAPGYVFGHWNGGTASNIIGPVDNPKQLLLNENKSITANFVPSGALEPRFMLTRVINPPGAGEIGLQPPPGSDGRYSSGTIVTVTAYPAQGKTFTSWSGAITGTQNPRQILINDNKTITANFSTVEQPRFSLTRIVNPVGGGVINATPQPGQDGKYSSGTVVTLFAAPSAGYSFAGWNNGENATIGNQNPLHVTVTSNKTVIANFVLQQEAPRFTLLATSNPNGGGYVSLFPEPGLDGKYSSGTVVTMTAHPGQGYVFMGWSGAGSGIEPAVINPQNPRQIVMNENKSFIAYFEQVQEQPRFTLFRIVSPPGTGEISAQPLPGNDGKYTSGTIVTLTAHPATGNTFLNWGGAISGTENPKHIVMNGNKEVVANFSGSTNAARFVLTRNVTPAGAGHIELYPAPGEDGKYSSGTVVLCGAYPSAGFSFSHWAGASDSTSNPIQIKMTENKSITAVFEAVSAQSADVMVHLNLSHNPVIVHSPYIMTVHVANLGPSSATNTRFEVHLPPGTQYTSATLSQGSINQTAGGALVANLGTMPAGAHAVAGLILVPHTTGTLETNVNVHAEQPDPYLPNNAAHCAVRVVSQFLPSPDLTGYPGVLTRRATSTASKITGNFVFANSGELSSGKCVVHYYLSDDDVLDPTDQLVRTQRLGSLRAGLAVSKKFSLKLQANAEGRHIIGVLDPGDANLETNEVNNTIVSSPVQ